MSPQHLLSDTPHITKNNHSTIFKTITDESTGAIKSVGLFGKSIRELKSNFFSIRKNGIFNTLFNTSTIDTNVINTYNLAIKEAINNGATMADRQKIMQSAMKDTNRATSQLIGSTKGAIVETNALTLAQKQSTFAAKAHSTALKGLSIVGNILAGIGLSLVTFKVVSFIHEMVTANEQLLNSVKELSSEFKETESSINGYKDKIEELHKTINNGTSSISDVTQSRKDLMKIQDDLIENFGTEKETIDIVTEAINGQSDALEHLTQKKWC